MSDLSAYKIYIHKRTKLRAAQGKIKLRIEELESKPGYDFNEVLRLKKELEELDVQFANLEKPDYLR